MTSNVVAFPNPDEVELEIFAFESQDDLDYNSGFDLGYTQGQKAKAAAEALTEGMTDAENAGFWDGFYD